MDLNRNDRISGHPHNNRRHYQYHSTRDRRHCLIRLYTSRRRGGGGGGGSDRSNNNNNNNNNNSDEATTLKTDTEVTVVTVERPDPSLLLSSQSDTIQQLGFVAIVTGLLFGTIACINGLSFLEYNVVPSLDWYRTWRDVTWPIPLGLIFILAGMTHFTMTETYRAMVPPIGTWGGVWQIPTPFIERIPTVLLFSNNNKPLSYADYHVYWSGIAEMGGGLLLILSATNTIPIIPIQIPSFLLCLLLIGITPANIYMATHGIQAPTLPPIPYPNGHLGRGLLQCVLIALCYKLTFQ